MLKKAKSPIARFPERRLFSQDLGLWVVAHTKPRQEKALARDCAALNISYYLPLMEKRIRRRDNNKPRKSIIVLFNGYIALAPTGVQMEGLFSRNRLIRLINVADQTAFVKELEQIEAVLAAAVPIEKVSLWMPGEPVRVNRGPLMGLEGVVIRQKGKGIFTLKMKMFQKCISVDIDEDFLELL